MLMSNGNIINYFSFLEIMHTIYNNSMRTISMCTVLCSTDYDMTFMKKLNQNLKL